MVVFGWSDGDVFLELDVAFGLEGLAIGQVTGRAQVVSEGTGKGAAEVEPVLIEG